MVEKGQLGEVVSFGGFTYVKRAEGNIRSFFLGCDCGHIIRFMLVHNAH